jgi:hypothetical protein
MAAVRMCGFVAVLALLFGVAACRSSHFETPDVQGPPAMVMHAGQPRLWMLSKQEEQRQVSVGGGSRYSTPKWRTDTFFHFSLQAIDPLSGKSAWTQRLLTFGDPEAKGSAPSRVIGSSVSARLLGQDGEVVWLLIGPAPYAVSVADGSILADGDKLQQLNPELQDLLPSEARHYGFDQGLVLMSADARRFVVRGAGFKAASYVPPPPPTEAPGKLLASGRHEMAPMHPLDEEPLRQTTLGGQWLGLFSEKEAEDISSDDDGSTLRYPWSVHNEGSLARRTLWRARIGTVKHFDDVFEQLADLAPVAGAPTFLKGRFASDGRTGQPMRLENPAGVLVWHSTRMDSAGRIALARLDENLKTVWKSELPLSETNFVRRLQTWPVPGHLVVVGELQSEDAGVTSRDDYLISIDLANGKVVSRKLNAAD